MTGMAAHAVLTDAEVDEVAARVLDGLGLGVGQGHAGVAGQVGAARDDAGDDRGGGTEAGVERLPGGQGTVVGGEGGEMGLPTGQAPPPLGGVPPVLVARPGVEALLPLRAPGLTAGDAAAVQIQDVVRHPERLVGRQAEQLLGQADLIGREGVAVGLGGIGQMG
jgi:hypothetical protein